MLDKLIPPDDPKSVTRWRWVVAIGLGVLLVNGAAGRGMIPLLNGAYASEAALTDQTKKIDKLLKLQIATTLRDLRKEECRANGNKHIIQDTIEEYQQQYIEVAHTRYPLPKCEETGDD